MQSNLPVRGHSVAIAALAALLLRAVHTGTASADEGGGFSADSALVAAPLVNASMNPDSRTAVAPVGAPQQVVDAIAAADRITRKGRRPRALAR